MKKSLVAVYFLFVLLLSVFPKFPFISSAYAVDCAGTDLPTIPFSVTPASGNYKDTFIATLGWGEMQEKDFKKYKDEGINVRMEIVHNDDPRKVPVTYSQQDIEDLSYLRVKRTNQSYKFSNFFLPPRNEPNEPYILNLHLVVSYESSTRCKLEASPASISVISTYVENPKPGDTSIGLKAGDVCNRDLQNDPNFACPVGKTCKKEMNQTGSGTFICTDIDPVYKESARSPKVCGQPSEDGKICLKINTALGPIDTDPQNFVKWLFSVVLGLAGGIALIIIMISGYKFMASQGDPEKVGEARQQLTSAIVGLLFIIFSFVILEVIGVDILKIPGFQP